MKHGLYSLFLLSLLFSCKPANTPDPIEKKLSEAETRLPENALHGLSIAEGLEAQLFAAEPMVRNPSNIDIDHRGRVWVVENVNYRPENNPDNPYQDGGDMVVILEDTDGDGQADDRKIFYQDLLVDGAMGIGVFDNRVYLSSSPHILILTDDDRDDQADRVDTLFTGMGNKQGDHTVHAVSFGPDGRLYFNFGNAGQKMLHKDGSPVIDKMGNVVKSTGVPYQQGMVFRCEMDGSSLETLGHNFRNNYEVCVDSYGRMWQSDNDDDGNKAVRINYVMEYGNFGYRDELTQEAWQVSRSGMHPNIPSRHWHQNDPGVVPNLYITGSGSPCGITAYEGDLLPEVFQGQLLHADAGPGSARAYPVKDAGAGFTAHEEPMLMRKADAWYRPTDVSVAPDGSVLASDWYDPGVGGHWAGDALRGRVFRIAPSTNTYRFPEAKFDTPQAAAESLKSPNAATRYLAWTALNTFGQQAERALTGLWMQDNPIYRARALWLLARLKKEHLQNALEDTDDLLRSTAIRVARQLYADEIMPVLQKMAQDPSAKVRREVAIALREIESTAMPEIWANLAVQHDGKDRWYLEALGIGAKGKWDACFAAWLKKVKHEWDNPAGRDIIWRSRAQQSFSYLLTILQKPDLAATDQARYLRATDFVSAPNKDQLLAQLITTERKDQAEFQQMLLTHISPEYARSSVQVKQATRSLLPNLRGSKKYLDLVNKLQLKEEVPQLLQMVREQPNHELGVRAAELIIELEGWDPIEEAINGQDQLAMISVLRNINRKPGKELLKKLILDEQLSMANRKKALDALSFDWGWENRVIKLLKSQTLPEELVTAAATQLLNAARPIDRAEGMKYLDGINTSDQKISSIQNLVQMEGNVPLGKEVFDLYCQTCHQVNQVGTAFGPDLSEIANKLGKDALYSAIIYPNAAISHGYEGTHFELKDGANYVGYVLSENGEKVELKVQNGAVLNLAKTDITARENLTQSLMTAGLDQAIGEEKLVDLVSYLSTLSNQQTMVSNPFQGKIGYERANE